MAPRPKENSKQKRKTRTAPHCDTGSLRMANQVATGAGKAFAYGTGAGVSLRMANQEATGAGKAFAYGTGVARSSRRAGLLPKASYYSSICERGPVEAKERVYKQLRDQTY